MRLLEDIVGELEDAKEEERLDEIWNSRKYKWVSFFFELVIKSGAQVALKSLPGEFSDILVAKLRPEVPRWISDNKLASRLWKFIHLWPLVGLRFFLFSWLLWYLNFRAYHLYRHDKMLKKVSQASGKARCGLESELMTNDARWMMELGTWLQALGTVLSGAPGIGVATFSVIGILPYLFYHLAQIKIRLQPLRVPHLGFLYQPREARHQVASELRDIISKLMESVGRKRGFHREARPQEQRELAFVRLLLELELEGGAVRSVAPICVSSRWLATLVRLHHRMLLVSFFVGFCYPIYCMTFAVCLEIMLRTWRRLERFECALQQPGSLPVGHFMLVLPPLNNEASERAYLEHDGSWAGLAKLGFTVEAPLYFTSAACLSLLLYCLIIFILALLGSCWVNLFIFATLDKLVWMAQIRRQLAQCLASAHLVAAADPLDALELERRLTLAYLNYELFRRRHLDFRHLGRFYIRQALAVGLAGFGIFYLVGTSVRTTTVPLLFFIMSAIACIVNVFLAGSSLVAKRAERIMSDLHRLLARLAEHQSQASSSPSEGHLWPVELWRRQCLSEGETRRFYATSLFGIYVSYENLLSFNLYTVGIFLLIIKMNK